VTDTRAFGCSIKWSDKRKAVKEAFKRWAKEEVSLAMLNDESLQSLLKAETGKL